MALGTARAALPAHPPAVGVLVAWRLEGRPPGEELVGQHAQAPVVHAAGAKGVRTSHASLHTKHGRQALAEECSWDQGQDQRLRAAVMCTKSVSTCSCPPFFRTICRALAPPPSQVAGSPVSRIVCACVYMPGGLVFLCKRTVLQNPAAASRAAEQSPRSPTPSCYDALCSTLLPASPVPPG